MQEGYTHACVAQYCQDLAFSTFCLWMELFNYGLDFISA